MILKEEKANLSQKEQNACDYYFKHNDSDCNNDVKCENKDNENVNKNSNGSINKSEKNNINDAQVEIIDINVNEKKKNINYNNEFENNINEPKENDLLDSKIIKSKSNNKNLFSIQKLDGPNDCNIIGQKSLSKKRKRGRIKKSKDRRFHSKNAKDNIDLKINGLIIDSFLIFINKKLKKKLKKVRYKEKIKFDMNKRVKNIYEKVSEKFGENYNKDIIDNCSGRLKKIFNLQMYKVIQAISGKKVKILKNLRKEYNSLKEKKLLREDYEYIKLFKIREARIINLALDKSPIIKENTKNEVLNSKINININVISNYNAKISEITEFSNDKTTKAQTLDSKKNIDKTFVCNTNNGNLDIKVVPYQNPDIETLLGQMPDISNFNDKSFETEKIVEMPHFSNNNNNMGDSDSSSSKYSLFKPQQENDDIF